MSEQSKIENLAKDIRNFGTKKRSEKLCLAQRHKGRQGDGPRAVIPSGCEGSKKDFSLRSK